MRSVDDQVRQASAEASVQSAETIESLRIEVVRLKQSRTDHARIARALGKAEGMYAAAVKMDSCEGLSELSRIVAAAAIRIAAKEQA